MLDQFYADPLTLQRLREGPLGPYIGAHIRCTGNLFPLRSAGNYWDTHFAGPGRPLCGQSPQRLCSKTRSARCLGYPAACSRVIYSP